MKSWMKCATVWSAGLLAALSVVVAADKEAPAGGLVIIDAKGKEQKLKTWEFTEGTRRLSWLASARDKEPEKKDGKDDSDDRKRRVPARPRVQGPEALVFRDENSTVWQKGVLTLIPVDRLRSIDYDNEKQTATVKVAAGEKSENDVELTGTTRFRGTNRLIIEAEVDKGELGVADLSRSCHPRCVTSARKCGRPAPG